MPRLALLSFCNEMRKKFKPLLPPRGNYPTAEPTEDTDLPLADQGEPPELPQKVAWHQDCKLEERRSSQIPPSASSKTGTGSPGKWFNPHP